jgi:hypothetical protein
MAAFSVDTVSGFPASEVTLSLELDRLRATIVAELARAGVVLPDAALTPIVDVVLEDAIRLALAWLEEGADRRFNP